MLLRYFFAEYSLAFEELCIEDLLRPLNLLLVKLATTFCYRRAYTYCNDHNDMPQTICLIFCSTPKEEVSSGKS